MGLCSEVYVGVLIFLSAVDYCRGFGESRSSDQCFERAVPETCRDYEGMPWAVLQVNSLWLIGWGWYYYCCWMILTSYDYNRQQGFVFNSHD